ncbi:hypothetical protein Tco_0126701 [Tanacetum coccineum]
MTISINSGYNNHRTREKLGYFVCFLCVVAHTYVVNVEHGFLSLGGRGVKQKKILNNANASSDNVDHIEVDVRKNDASSSSLSNVVRGPLCSILEPSKKVANLCTLITPAGNGDDVDASLTSFLEVNDWFSNSVYRFLLPIRVAYLIVENYVKNTWSKYALAKTMKNSKGLIFFKFSSKDEMDVMLKNGPCYARAMIELRADAELKYSLVVAVPKIQVMGILCTLSVGI